MGIYKNHSGVYINRQPIAAPNQAFSKQDVLSEANLQIIQSLKRINEDLHFKKEDDVATKLELLNKINSLTETIKEINNRLDKSEAVTQQFSERLKAQLDLQKETAEKITVQEEFQGEVLRRLDTQEALVDKISHQLNHIRSIIFERTNFLAARIEDGYRVTSSYVYKLMTGSDQPLTFFLMNQKKTENQQQNDELPK